MIKSRASRATTCIYIQVKRGNETYFVLADEYDLVEAVKARLLNLLAEIGFTLERQEEPLTTEDLRLYLKRRVSHLPQTVSDSNLFLLLGARQYGFLSRSTGFQQRHSVSRLQEAWNEG